MGSILGDAPVPYSPDEDEDQLDPLKNQPPPPPPVNTGEVPFAQGQTPPVYGPPAPTQTPYWDQVQQLFQQNPNLSNIAAGEAQANNAPTNIGNYISNYQAQTNTGDFPAPAGGIPGYNLTPAGREDVQAPLDALRAQAIGQQAPNAGYVPTVNADYRESPLTSAMRVASGPMQIYQGLNPEIPFVTPAIENYVKPLAAYGINQTSPGAALNTISQALGGPNIGQLAADQGIPSHGLDLALAAAPFAGGGIDAARGLYGAGRSVLESAALEGLGAPGRSLEALGGREAAAVQLHGGVPAGASIDPLNHGTPDLGMMAQMAGGEANAPGGRLYTPENEPYGYHDPNAAQQAYEAAYRATPGTAQDKLLNAEAARQEVLSGETLPGNYSAVPQEGVMPNRNGTPLAYDPTFSGGSGYRETIAPPTGVVAPYVPPREPEITLGRELRGNAETAAMQQPFSHEVGALPPELLQNELDATNRIISQNLTPYETEPHRIEMWNSLRDDQRAGITQQYNEAIDRRSQLTSEMERRGMSPQMTEGLYRPIGGVEPGRMPPEEVAQQLSQRLEGGASPNPNSPVERGFSYGAKEHPTIDEVRGNNDALNGMSGHDADAYTLARQLAEDARNGTNLANDPAFVKSLEYITPEEQAAIRAEHASRLEGGPSPEGVAASSSVSPLPPSPMDSLVADANRVGAGEITMGPEDAARARDAENAATEGYLNKPVGEANPVGTGQQLANEVAASDPNLTQTQRDFLSNGQPTNFRDLAEQAHTSDRGGLPQGAGSEAATAQRQAGIDAGLRPSETGGVPPSGGGPPGVSNSSGGMSHGFDPGEWAVRGVPDVLREVNAIPREILTTGHPLTWVLQNFVQTVSHPFVTFLGTAEHNSPMLEQLRAGWAALSKNEGLMQDIGNNLKSQYANHYPGLTERLSTYHGAGTAGEEAFQSRVLHNLPGIGRAFDASKDAMAVMTSAERVALFDKWVSAFKDSTGAMPAPKVASDLQRWLNISTGRGEIPNALKPLSGPLATAALGPRLFLSRIETPIAWTFLRSPDVQATIASDLIKTFGAIGGLTGLAAASGQFKVSTDPRSADFGKWVAGPMHVDPWGGFQQIARTVAQLYTGERVNGKGNVVPQDWKVTAANFLLSHAAPTPQIGLDIAMGKNVQAELNGIDAPLGRDWPSIQKEVTDHVAPIFIGHLADAIKSYGTAQGAAIGAATLPFRTQIYDQTPGNPLSQMRNDALGGSSKYADLMPHEQQALNQALQAKDPAGYAKALSASQEGQNPAITANQQARDAVKTDRNTQIAPIVQGVSSGTYSPGAAYQAIKEIQNTANERNAALLHDPKYLEATKDFSNNDSVARRALDTYYAIPNSAKGPDGKVDWNRADQIRAELIASLEKAGQGDVARRIQRETETSNLYEDLKKLAPVK